MNLREAIQCEIELETTAGNRVERIRVTGAALAGSVVCMPIQSKRFELGIRRESRRELLVHPDDWTILLREMEGITGSGIPALRRAFGLPVADEA